MVTIVKATSKGQITLPAKWRNDFSTDRFLIKQINNKLEIIPLDMDKLEAQTEYTVFDALRDNKGQGMKAKDLINVLKDLS